MILPLRYEGRFYIPRQERFVTYLDEDVPFLLWAGWCREAGRGENRTTRCLHDLFEVSKHNHLTFFVTENTYHAERCCEYFCKLFYNQRTIEKRHNRLTIFHPEERQIVFTSIAAFNPRGHRNFDVVYDHDWNSTPSEAEYQRNLQTARLAYLSSLRSKQV